MQNDYGLFKTPIFSMSKYAMYEQDLVDNIKSYFMISKPSLGKSSTKEQKEALNAKLRAFETVHVSVTSLKDKFVTPGVKKEALIPNKIRFNIIYFVDLSPDPVYPKENIKNKIILKADIELDEYKEIIFDREKVYDEYFKLFNLTFPKPNVVKTESNKEQIFYVNLYNFVRDFFNYNFMGYTNWLIINYFSNTTQFKRDFRNYFDYQNLNHSLNPVPEPSQEICKNTFNF